MGSDIGEEEKSGIERKARRRKIDYEISGVIAKSTFMKISKMSKKYRVPMWKIAKKMIENSENNIEEICKE